MSIPSNVHQLIHDPTRLLELLYSKYGDIEEDFDVLYINQILYRKKSHYSTLYREMLFKNEQDEEFLKRFYASHEIKTRIPKIANYYRNYQKFFCKPTICSYFTHKLLSKYSDNKAEIFYKNNYLTKSKQSNKEEKSDSSSSSNSALTNNKTIFDKKTRLLIDNINSKPSATITLESTTTNANNNVLYSKRSLNDSFNQIVSGLLPEKIQVNRKQHSTEKSVKVYSRKSLCSLKKNTFLNSSKFVLSPKITPFLSNFKSSIGEFSKISNKTATFHSNRNTNSATLQKNNTLNFNNFNGIQKMKKQHNISNAQNSNNIANNVNIEYNNSRSAVSGKNKITLKKTSMKLFSKHKINLKTPNQNSSVVNYLNMIIKMKNSKISKNSVQSQRSTSSTSNTNIKSEFVSRNKKISMANQTQTMLIQHHSSQLNRMSGIKVTKSIDEKEFGAGKIRTFLPQKKDRHRYQMSQKLTNQIDDLIKRTNYKVSSNSNSKATKSNSKLFYNTMRTTLTKSSSKKTNEKKTFRFSSKKSQ